MNIARLSRKLVASILATLSIMLAASAKGQTGNYNGFKWYQIATNAVVIYGYTGPAGAVVIPSTISNLAVTTIGADEAAAFGTNVTSVTIPSSVTSIEEDAFYGCTSLTSVTIPNSITSIELDTFNDCTSLTGITIPNSVTNIGNGAFYGCTSLTSVTIPDSVTSLGVDIAEFGSYGAFADCTSLTSVTIPGRVASIGPSLFAGCTTLTSVRIANGITTIGDEMFAGCTSLTSVTIPSSVTNIGMGAFFGCTSLTSVTIPDSVTSIGDGMFEYCTGLISISIPGNVTNIGYYTFDDCTELKNVCFEGNQPSGGSPFFYDPALSAIYYVKGTTGWGATFSGVKTAPCTQCGGAVTITGNVYCACDSNAIVGASVQIGDYSATSDSGGYYTIANVQASNYTAMISATNYATLTTNLDVSSAMSEVTNDFYLTNLTLVINPIFDTNITTKANAYEITNSIISAIQVLEQHIANPICVKILFSATTDTNVLAESMTPTNDLEYSNYLSALQAKPNKSAFALTALSNMPTNSNTGINGASQVSLTAANLMVVGRADLASSLVAGNGGYNSKITFNLSQFNASRPGLNLDLYDLQSAAAHEIDEVLGIGGNGSTLYQPGATPPESLPTDVGPLDFFRYRDPGANSFAYDPSVMTYFSIDGGNTKLVNFNQNGASNADFGDWGSTNGTRTGNVPPQVQDAFGTPGETSNLGANELIALDVVGYTLLSTPPTTQNAAHAANTFSFGWTALPGQSYQVQYASNLAGNSWNNLGGPITAINLTASISDTNASNAERFYRVVALLQSPSPALARFRPQAIVTPFTPITNALITHHFLRARP